MPTPSGLITLLTDFGDRDWFVASMKGAILSIHPHATIVDLSHRVPAHAVEDGAYLLKSCYRYFPEGTIHVAVVDPGVGSGRRPLIVKSSRYFFLAPDNGLLTHVFNEEKDHEIRELENTRFRLESAGHTFDGRDVFAPAAAWLAKGEPFESFGPVLVDCKKWSIAVPRWEGGQLIGEVAYVDRFGNLITNVTVAHLKEVREVLGRPMPFIRIGECLIDGLVNSYSEGDPEAPRALINSEGAVEIFLNQANAAEQLSLGRKTRVVLS